MHGRIGYAETLLNQLTNSKKEQEMWIWLIPEE